MESLQLRLCLSLLNQDLLPIMYNLVILDPFVEKFFVGQTILNQIEFWKIKLQDCNTRIQDPVAKF